MLRIYLPKVVRPLLFVSIAFLLNACAGTGTRLDYPSGYQVVRQFENIETAQGTLVSNVQKNPKNERFIFLKLQDGKKTIWRITARITFDFDLQKTTISISNESVYIRFWMFKTDRTSTHAWNIRTGKYLGPDLTKP